MLFIVYFFRLVSTLGHRHEKKALLKQKKLRLGSFKVLKIQKFKGLNILF